MSKFYKILLWCLMLVSAVLLVLFYVQNNTGVFAISNLSKVLTMTTMVDGLMYWTYILIFAALILLVVLTVLNLFGNKKGLKSMAITLVLAIVVVGGSYLLAPGSPVAVNIDPAPTFGTYKLTDTCLIITYVLFAAAIVALVWGAVRKTLKR